MYIGLYIILYPLTGHLSPSLQQLVFLFVFGFLVQAETSGE